MTEKVDEIIKDRNASPEWKIIELRNIITNLARDNKDLEESVGLLRMQVEEQKNEIERIEK